MVLWGATRTAPAMTHKKIVIWSGILIYEETIEKHFKMSKCKFVLFISVLFISAGCASVMKPRFNYKKKESECNLGNLVGPDKYFYSAHYQRKLKFMKKRFKRK